MNTHIDIQVKYHFDTKIHKFYESSAKNRPDKHITVQK